MKKIVLFIFSGLAMISITAFTIIHASGITGYSGSPRDGGATCSSCHSGGTAPTVSISATPAFGTGSTYVPSTTYTISVVASGTARYGMNLEILNGTSSSSTNAGTFGTVVTTNCTKSGTAPTTITHNQATTSGVFSFRWTAPASGNAYLYSCVLGANGNGSTNGDKIKQTNLTLTPGSSTALTITTTAVNVKCYGNNSGSATATATGTPPYTYSWSTLPVQITATATGLAAGTYTVTVHDANGSNTSIITVSQPSSALASSVTTTNANCGSANGTASASASGGTPGYSYLWSNGKVTASITGLLANTYSVTVTDANGCTSLSVANVLNTGAPAVTTSPTDASSCSASDGSITSNVSGGTAPYTYMWSNGKTTLTISGLSTGNYTLTVTDHSGCLQSSVATVSCPSSNVDAGVNSVGNPTGIMCATTFVPIVTLKNFGATTLTSCTINYYIDNPPAQQFNWVGSLASGASVNKNLPSISGVSVGSHVFYCSSSNPNGSTDANTTNDQSQSSFTISNTSATIPLMEGFESSANLPIGWTLWNPDNDAAWQVVTTVAHTGNNCIGFDNCDGDGIGVDMTGTKDRFITSAYDFTNAASSASISFDIAYSVFNYKNQLQADTLAVFYSTDCGTTWNQIYLKGGATLSDSTTSLSCWSPSSSDWRTENINVGNLAGQVSVIFAFENRSDWGEWIYIDNINILAVTGIASINPLSGFNIYPNPVATSFTIEGISSAQKIHYAIYNIIGEQIKTGEIQTNGSDFSGKIYVSDIPKGMYFIKINDGKNTYTKKLNVE